MLTALSSDRLWGVTPCVSGKGQYTSACKHTHAHVRTCAHMHAESTDVDNLTRRHLGFPTSEINKAFPAEVSRALWALHGSFTGRPSNQRKIGSAERQGCRNDDTRASDSSQTRNCRICHLEPKTRVSMRSSGSRTESRFAASPRQGIIRPWARIRRKWPHDQWVRWLTNCKLHVACCLRSRSLSMFQTRRRSSHPARPAPGGDVKVASHSLHCLY